MEQINNLKIPAEKVREVQSNVVNSSRVINQHQVNVTLNMPGDTKKLTSRSRRLIEELSEELNMAVARGELL